jgi:hypothetical protein
VSLPIFCGGLKHASADRLVLARGTKTRGRGVAVGFKRICLLSSFRTECECVSHNCRLLIAMLRNESCIQQNANKHVTQHTEHQEPGHNAHSRSSDEYATRYNVFPSAVAICISVARVSSACYFEAPKLRRNTAKSALPILTSLWDTVWPSLQRKGSAKDFERAYGCGTCPSRRRLLLTRAAGGRFQNRPSWHKNVVEFNP